ncbi:DUF2063 domain-containing protein [Pseudomaricurvus sp. HS19]|uniref:HvfC family RiPP maturation protein n=1 Tax=Pseudomaricurvus sp. HS19 TaxID=2692626 RepID=UPI00136D8FBA|nr:putative DNA-binding domain-containing protein [Pseudomaricurvus sp. HS19]MYM61995.1 DUF2063 domain-containing protein [Pseudomaricurvus sp. HS19]
MSFAGVQKQLADHLRDPQQVAPPGAMEERRLAIYRELVFNNIEGFLSSGFPVLRSLYDDEAWLGLVREFIRTHRSESPYFLQISEEFLAFLQEEYQPGAADPAFLLELAHYEWVELALDVSTEEIPESSHTAGLSPEQLLDTRLSLSPLVWRLSYQFPVHRIGPDYRPAEPPAEPIFLLVYRNRQQQVRFMESNALTVHLLNLLEEGLSGRAALQTLAADLQHPHPEQLLAMGAKLLAQLVGSDILV